MAKTYQEIFQERFKALCVEHKWLQAWQARLEMKKLQPELFQAVFGQSRHEKYVGPVARLVVEHAPELAEEL